MDETKVIVDPNELIGMRWKTGICHTGESCWCRTISPEDNVQYADGVEAYIAPDGTISKSHAEHIVKLHNDWLEKKS